MSNSPAKPSFSMAGLDAIMDDYFSPKRKSSSKSPCKSPLKSPRNSPAKPPKRTSSTGARRTINFSTVEEDEAEAAAAEKENAGVDSSENKTTATATTSKMGIDAVETYFKHVDSYMPEKKRIDEYQEHFPTWTKWLLTKEFSVMLNGIGSSVAKFQLLKDYVRVELDNCNRILFDGSSPLVTAHSILETICTEFKLGKLKKRGINPVKFANRVCCAMEKNGWSIFILIHSIDGPGLRHPLQQEALSILSKHFYLIASADHANVGLMWSQKTRDSFRWLLFPISTVEQPQLNPARILGLHGKEKKETGSSHTLASLEAFWSATTKNQHKLLELLALHAGAQGDKITAEPLMLPKLCKIMKDEFATTNETVLRSQLVEFTDHMLIHLGKDGSIQLTVDRNTLVTFLEQKLVD